MTDTFVPSSTAALDNTLSAESHSRQERQWSAVVEHLRAIHILHLARARQDSILIPAEISFGVKALVQAAGLERTRYDEDEAISYQIRQLPAESTLSLPEWNEFFSFNLPRPVVGNDNSISIGLGLTKVLSWSLDPRPSTYVDHSELGYDGSGNLYRFERQQAHNNGYSPCPRQIEEHIVGCIWTR